MLEQQWTAGGIQITTTHYTCFDGLQASTGPLIALQLCIEDRGTFLREKAGPALEQGSWLHQMLLWCNQKLF